MDKTPVALYIWAAASWAFPPIQVDIGQVNVTPVSAGQAVVSPAYGFTGEWWESDLELLHLRARWYLPETGTFLSRDPVESEPPYLYVRGNPVNRIDPSGLIPECQDSKCKIELGSSVVFNLAEGGLDWTGYETSGHLVIVHTDRLGTKTTVDALPEKRNDEVKWEERILNNWNLQDTGIERLLFGWVPVVSIPLWDPFLHPDEGVAGIMRMNTTDNQGIINDFIHHPDTMIATVAEGEQTCDALECIRNAMRQVEENKIAYYLLGPNSNSAAHSVLRYCKWQTTQAISQFQEAGRLHPGSSLYLLSWLANKR